jgi:3-hydroxybutyryl-CoA dehydratase
MMQQDKGPDFGSLAEGMEASFSQVITESHIRSFSEISGDYNPIHLDKEYAGNSRYKGVIAHGLLSASFFSGLFGTKLPGPGCVYVSQTLRFIRPIYPGDTVTATVTIKSIDAKKRRIVFDTKCNVKGKIAICGEAEIYVPIP